jgi:hypothetical protein
MEAKIIFLSEMLQEIISSLTKQEQEILFYAFFTDMEISEIVYLLKPHTKYDRERLYKRSKNSLKIFTSEGELEYIFCVYKNAKSRKFGEVGSNVIRPISHPHLENYQERSRMEMTFAAKDVKKIILNGKDITSNLQILKNESFEKAPIKGNADGTSFEKIQNAKTVPVAFQANGQYGTLLPIVQSIQNLRRRIYLDSVNITLPTQDNTTTTIREPLLNIKGEILYHGKN